jgi:hypothetical protein
VVGARAAVVRDHHHEVVVPSTAQASQFMIGLRV